jgi:hypothetical protein
MLQIFMKLALHIMLLEDAPLHDMQQHGNHVNLRN